MRTRVFAFPGLFALGSLVGTAGADIINVPADQPTIQAAIDVASDNDEIIVAPGTYGERIDFTGKAITVRSTDPLDPAIVGSTIIDGGALGSVVTCASGEGAGSILSGITVTNGLSDYGGGMYVGQSSPTVTLCTFSGNRADLKGGGMYLDGAGARVSSCTFNDNSGGDGGGMLNHDSFTIVANCSFIGNSSGYDGGGIRNDGGSPMIVGCVFRGNVVEYSGGGVSNAGSTPVLSSCLFVGNTAEWFGGGLHNHQSSPVVTNSTFVGNICDAGGALSNYESSPVLRNCILWNNTGVEVYGGSPSIEFCVVDGGWPGPGNTDEDPKFVSPAYSIAPDSPCIDAGNNDAVPPDTPDLDGDGDTTEPLPFDLHGGARIVDGDVDGTADVDMGAYERDPDGCPQDLDGNGAIDVIDLLHLLSMWGPCAGCWQDLDGSGAVDIVDLGLLLGAWGSC